MAITVDSSQWTGERDSDALTGEVVWGEFADEAARDQARRALRLGGARDEDAPPQPARPAHGEGTTPPLDTPDENPREADLRNQRQLGVGVAMAATSMAAAGLVIASGGALAPAVGAAVAAGAGTGALGQAVAAAITPDKSPEEAHVAPTDGPLIGIRAPDEAARHRAEAVLREHGAKRIFVRPV